MNAAANRRGALLMTLAMAAFAIEDMLFKFATQSAPVGPATMVFGAVGLVLFSVLSLAQGSALWPRAFFHSAQIIRSVIELGGRLFYALALAFAPLASTSAILQATPLVVTAGAALLFGEVVGWRRWVSMLVGFAGVLLVIRPTAGSFEAASLFALLGMLGFAGRDLATRAAPKTLSMAQLGTLGFAVVVLAGLVLTLASGQRPALPGGAPLLMLIGAGVIGALAYGALTAAMRAGEIGFIAPFRYTRLVFALILALLLFGERPDVWVYVGAFIIVAAGLYSFLRERHTGKRRANALERR